MASGAENLTVEETVAKQCMLTSLVKRRQQNCCGKRCAVIVIGYCVSLLVVLRCCSLSCSLFVIVFVVPFCFYPFLIC